jgi:hypothetical protein
MLDTLPEPKAHRENAMRLRFLPVGPGEPQQDTIIMQYYWLLAPGRTIEIVSTSGFFGSVQHLTLDRDNLHGEERVFTDVQNGTPNPSWRVAGHRIPCK